MNKFCAIHQPNFLPWLGFFYKIQNSDVFIILDDVEISLSSAKAITNRTRIKTQQSVQYLTVPVLKGSSMLIKDIKIDNKQNWRTKHLKTIYYSYKKVVGFEFVYPFVEKLYSLETDSLSEFNVESIKLIMRLLNVEKDLLLASEIENISTDRNQRIIDLCNYTNSSNYLSGFGAKKYHNEELFSLNSVNIVYTDFVHPVYEQAHGDFVEGLSAIDYCFNKVWK